MADWEARRKDAERWRPDDEVSRPESPNPYNHSVYQRRQDVQDAFRTEGLRRARGRSDDLVNVLLIALHERGTRTLTWNDAFAGDVAERLAQADTPEARRQLRTVLDGLRGAPNSWAKSATARFFRGTGQQGKPPWSERPGVGALGKSHGWKQYETAWFVGFFYSWPFNELLSEDPGFIGELVGVLEQRGLEDTPSAATASGVPAAP